MNQEPQDTENEALFETRARLDAIHGLQRHLQACRDRRERIATAVLGGIAASGWDLEVEKAIPLALKWADALVAAIDA